MGKRGPRPAPSHLKVVRGDRESRINRDEPIPGDSCEVQAPADMSADALKVWREVAPDLEDKGVLTSWDVYTFAVFCEAVAKWRECKKLMGSNYIAQGAAGGVIKSPYHQIMRDCEETMAKFGSRFGMSPGDRAALRIQQAEGDGPKSGAERILG